MPALATCSFEAFCASIEETPVSRHLPKAIYFWERLGDQEAEVMGLESLQNAINLERNLASICMQQASDSGAYTHEQIQDAAFYAARCG